MHNENWHPGVIGIVAARITEKFNTPSIVISENTDVCSASCRSVKSYDIGALIIELVENNILVSGGGHKMAGGFKIRRSKISELKINLRDRFNKSAQDLKKQFESELNISVINKEFFATIDKFSPYGVGNPKPKFLIRDCFIKYPRIVGEKHYSFFVENSFGDRIKAISFNSVGTSLGKVIETENFTKALIVSLTMNRWDGEESVELFLEDIVV